MAKDDQDKAMSAKTPMSVARIMGILYHVGGTSAGLNLTELSLALDVPKTSLLNLLPGMVSGGYLNKVGRSYFIGGRMIELADAIRNAQETPIEKCRPLMRRLAKDSGKTITLTVLSEDERSILHVAKEEPLNALRFAVEVGDTAPIHTTAGGRVMLAFREGDWVDHYFAHARLDKTTERSVVDKSLLQDLVLETRQNGYSVTKGETYLNIGAIAAPVFSESGFQFAVVAAGAVEVIERDESRFSSLITNTATSLTKLLKRAELGLR